MGRLSDKTAIVTGSGRNIGRAIAELFAAEGAAVVVNGLTNQASIDEVVDGIRQRGGRAVGILADVSQPAEIEAMLDQGERELGPIDIAVSNVGRRLRMKLEDISIETWDETLTHNLSSAFYMAHFLIPRMRRRGWGRLIHISGYDAFTGHMAERAANVTAKAGMHGLTKAIAREVGVDGITCNTVAPGAIRTVRDPEQYAHVDIGQVLDRLAIKHPGEPRDIAEACLYLASDAGAFVTGQVIHVNGGEFMF